VLQAVVAQDQVHRLAVQQGAHCPAPVRIDEQRHAGATHDQRRLVAGNGRVLIGQDPPGRARRPGTIAAADHADAQTAGPTVLDQPENQRSLAGAADGDVAHHDDRNRCAIDLTPAIEKRGAPALHHATIEGFEGTQQAQQRMAALLVPGLQQAVGEAHQGVAWASTVAMRRREKPSLPAASMAVTTVWCGALPSALMVSGRLVSPSDSRCREVIRLFRSLLTRALPFTEKLPSAPTSTSSGRSSVSSMGAPLAASGRSTFSRVSRVKVVVTTKNSNRMKTTSIRGARPISTVSRCLRRNFTPCCPRACCSRPDRRCARRAP